MIASVSKSIAIMRWAALFCLFVCSFAFSVSAASGLGGGEEGVRAVFFMRLLTAAGSRVVQARPYGSCAGSSRSTVLLVVEHVHAPLEVGVGIERLRAPALVVEIRLCARVRKAAAQAGRVRAANLFRHAIAIS